MTVSSALLQAIRASSYSTSVLGRMAQSVPKPTLGMQAAAFYEQSLTFSAARRSLTALFQPQVVSAIVPVHSQSLQGFVHQGTQKFRQQRCPRGVIRVELRASQNRAFSSSASGRRPVTRVYATPPAVSNLVIGPEPILKAQESPKDADLANWTPEDEWRDLVAPPSGRLLLVDGMAVAYRAYYKVDKKLQYNATQHASQEYPSAEEALTVLTFISNLVTLLELLPTHVGVVLDSGGKNFRHEMFPQYKQHRAAMPDTLVQAMPMIRGAIFALGVKLIESNGVEADDVIASLAVRGVEAGMKVRVASPDKDFFQILGPNLRLLRPRPRGIGIDSFGLAEFEAKFGGLRVDQFVDMQALMGDTADNIPGVFGIGEKTALKLLKEYDNLENIIANRESVMPMKARKALCNDFEALPSYRRLVLLRTQLDVLQTGQVDALNFAVPQDVAKIAVLLEALELNVPFSNSNFLKRRIERLWDMLSARKDHTLSGN